MSVVGQFPWAGVLGGGCAALGAVAAAAVDPWLLVYIGVFVLAVALHGAAGVRRHG